MPPKEQTLPHNILSTTGNIYTWTGKVFVEIILLLNEASKLHSIVGERNIAGVWKQFNLGTSWVECLRCVVHPSYWNKRKVLSTSSLFNAGYKIVCTISTLTICGGVCVTGAAPLRSTQLSEMSNLRMKNCMIKGAMSALIKSLWCLLSNTLKEQSLLSCISYVYIKC